MKGSTGIIIILVMIIVGFNINIAYTLGLFEDNTMYVIEITQNNTYHPIDINNQVINETKKYFEIEDYNDYTFTISNDKGVFRSSCQMRYNELENKTKTSIEYSIYMGFNNVNQDPETYKMIFTHEYTHYVLFNQRLYHVNMHEALAETYTWWGNREAHDKRYGEDNHLSQYPYNVILDKIITYDSNCLDKVFIETDKINNVEEYLDRLEIHCNVSKDYVKEQAGYNEQ